MSTIYRDQLNQEGLLPAGNSRLALGRDYQPDKDCKENHPCYNVHTFTLAPGADTSCNYLRLASIFPLLANPRRRYSRHRRSLPEEV
jgi:hypothetical protein